MINNMFAPPALEEIKEKYKLQETELNEIIAYLIDKKAYMVTKK